MNENKNVKQLLSNFFCAKRYYFDMIYDLLKVINIRKELFQARLTTEQLVDIKLVTNHLSGLQRKPKHKYRLYVVCGIRYIALCYIDIPEEFAENITNGLKQELHKYNESEVLELHPDFVNTIYMFCNSKIVYSCHIGSDHLAWIMNVLKYENLIDDRQEHRWTENFSDF